MRQQNRMGQLWGWGLGLLWAVCGGALWAGEAFSEMVRRAEHLYGPLGEGRQRLEDWQRLLGGQQGKHEAAQLEAVNRFFNRHLRFVDDRELWGVVDYWATPVQSLWRGAGDCEDFALAKYISLRYLGIAGEKLRITYVKALEQDQAHMVLTYYPGPGATPLVLDNLNEAILPASRRRDLLPVYAFNGSGLWYADHGEGRVGDSQRLSRWQDVLGKMHAEGFPGKLR